MDAPLSNTAESIGNDHDRGTIESTRAVGSLEYTPDQILAPRTPEHIRVLCVPT